jgi:hypothetical protein
VDENLQAVTSFQQQGSMEAGREGGSVKGGYKQKAQWTCGARCTNGVVPLRRILIRSESALVAACAQQEPQYWGMCWFRLSVARERPFRLRIS